jgi:hypothetical protein
MKKITVKIGDNVKLFNGNGGIVKDIDKSVYQFTLSEEYGFPINFHIRDIKELNGVLIDNDLLIF